MIFHACEDAFALLLWMEVLQETEADADVDEGSPLHHATPPPIPPGAGSTPLPSPAGRGAGRFRLPSPGPIRR